MQRRELMMIAAPVTGQTPLYCTQMQKEFQQDIYNKEWECYCLDAPLYINDGVTIFVHSGERLIGQQFGYYRG